MIGGVGEAALFQHAVDEFVIIEHERPVIALGSTGRHQWRHAEGLAEGAGVALAAQDAGGERHAMADDAVLEAVVGAIDVEGLHADDARDVMKALPDASLDRVMILFPDPWHKARHNKRRLLQDETAAEIARLLKPGGGLRFVTDWKDYADWALERFLRTPGLNWLAAEADMCSRAAASFRLCVSISSHSSASCLMS